MGVDSRPALPEDRPFLLDLYAHSRVGEFAAAGWSPEVLRAFLEQQYRAREASWAASAPDADDRVLQRDGHPVGRLVLERRAHGFRVVDIAVVPSEQGKGIGTQVLRGILDEADAARVPVTLHVVATNPARRLYERLGFTALPGADAVHLLMERNPVDQSVAQPNTAM